MEMHASFQSRRNFREKIVVVLRVMNLVLLCYSYIKSNTAIHLLANIIMYATVLCEKVEDDVLLYIFMAPMLMYAPSSIFRTYICMFISLAKLFIRNGYKVKISGVGLCACLFFTINILTFDYFIAGVSSFMTLLSLSIYIVIVMCERIPQRLNKSDLAWNLLLSTTIVLVTMHISSGVTFAEYANAANIQYRFGELTRDIGGSMGVSLYGIMAFAAAYYLLLDKTQKMKNKLLVVVLLAIVCVFEVFSLSRTFMITLALSSFILLYGIRKYLNKPKMVIFLSIFVIALASFVWKEYGNELKEMFVKLDVLLSETTQNGRFNLWTDSIIYFFSHPLTCLIGLGAQNYFIYPGAASYAFYEIGSHNLLLDMMLSWGTVGTVLLLFIIYKCFFENKKLRAWFSSETSHYVPLIMWLLAMMAQGSLREPTSFMYMLAVLTFVSSTKDNRERI